jgi:succinate-acetate transporter protein
MMILLVAMFLLLPMLVTLYLYVYGAFTSRRAFQSVFYTLVVLFALTIVIGIHHSYPVYDLLATISVSLSEARPKP